ncbi:MAG TPA: DUF6513 domain-containing protein [Planctomycetaceae bacterium]|nr:DUF6513 domain-containing protein [Planctomycetaceae bacterium]
MATKPRVLLVTGKLAEPSLRALVDSWGDAPHHYEIVVLPITVAALMHTDWVRRKLTVPEGIDCVVIPGWCGGDLSILSETFGLPVERGPKDLRELPEYFGRQRRPVPSLDTFTVEIIAEINHAPRLSPSELLREADRLRQQGADVIDLGNIPGEVWNGVGTAVTALKQSGLRVSIDSFERREVEAAVEAGAELVLSGQGPHLDWQTSIPAEFVIIPDTPEDIATLATTAATFQAAGRPVRWDPILEPIGFGFARSLRRYYQVREEHPDVPMMMGIGNITELSEVDSAGVNFLLAALCEELKMGSVLTTSVINWCQTAVNEFDLARRLVHHAIEQRTLPKHLHGDLVMLRDPRVFALGEQGLADLRQRITDPNFRIFAERGEVHLLNRDGYWHGSDPYEVFDRMIAAVGTLTAEHAFYLGMELMKARTALTLGKQYLQDEALRWGFLTVEEQSAIARRKSHGAKPQEESSGGSVR